MPLNDREWDTGDRVMYSACCLCTLHSSKEAKVREAVRPPAQGGGGLVLPGMLNITSMHGADDKVVGLIR